MEFYNSKSLNFKRKLEYSKNWILKCLNFKILWTFKIWSILYCDVHINVRPWELIRKERWLNSAVPSAEEAHLWTVLVAFSDKSECVPNQDQEPNACAHCSSSSLPYSGVIKRGDWSKSPRQLILHVKCTETFSHTPHPARGF